GRAEPVRGLPRRRRPPDALNPPATDTPARDAAPVTDDPAPDAVTTLDAIAAAPEFFERVVHRTTLPARAARTAPLRTPLHPDLEAPLAGRGIAAPYTHQAAAIDRLRAREHVVVAPGTELGKSLCH